MVGNVIGVSSSARHVRMDVWCWPESDCHSIYFSVVTLTTLGYGDITPAIPAARMLCSLEAVIGQLFVAVFIARMVALQIVGRSR